MTTRERRLQEAVQEIMHLAYNFPAGIEEDADPNNKSPDDAEAWGAGLIVQICERVLAETAERLTTGPKLSRPAAVEPGPAPEKRE